MKINKTTKNLIFDLEYIIGRACYNKESFDGFSKGQDFRYPVTIVRKSEDGKVMEEKFKGNLNDVPLKGLQDIKYRFGANQLNIGEALIEAINYLEKRYNLDFEELENNYLKENI